MKDWGNCWWLGNSTATQTWKKPVGSEQKILLCLRDMTHSPIKRHVPGSKGSTKSLPKLHSLTIHSFSLPPFACFSEPHRLIPAASTHQTLIPQLSASSLADLTGKWSFWLGSDAAMIRAMEIPSVKINSIAPAFSILGHLIITSKALASFFPPCSPVRKRWGRSPARLMPRMRNLPEWLEHHLVF